MPLTYYLPTYLLKIFLLLSDIFVKSYIHYETKTHENVVKILMGKSQGFHVILIHGIFHMEIPWKKH